MRIILIDDDYSVVENLALYLGQGFHTIESLTWVPGRQMLVNILDQFQPQGAIVDFGMDPQGDVICRWIKGWRNIPVVFYTSYAQNQEYRALMRSEVREDQIIEKREVGQDVDSLLRAIEEQEYDA